MSKKKNTTTPTPHDAAFRSFLANPDVARDFLELHLPAEYRQLCDLSTLKLEPATFVEPDLHQYASDILWSVKTTGGEDGYVYTLIEHQSTENLYMPFRMLRYSVNRPGFPGECFICELRLPDHRFRWKHNKLFLLLPEEYGPAFPAIVDCYTSPPT